MKRRRLDRARWSWEPAGWHLGLDLSNLNLPRLDWYWLTEHSGCMAFSFGNGNSDPVVIVDSPTFTPPLWLVPLLIRLDRG